MAARRVAITLEARRGSDRAGLGPYGTPDIVNADQGSQVTAEEFTTVVPAA